jgi:LmbE family N-acetylglucosaminyl deacetylase
MRMAGETLLVGLAHPDDELGAAGAILAQRARGDRVVIVWLTRGEMTEAFGPVSPEEVARRRTEQGRRAGEILDAEIRFLDYPDTRLAYSREIAREVAKVICEIQPTGLLTWGDAWVRGMRHPDHQAAGQIFRDAITLARIAKAVAPLPPYRGTLPIFTLRDVHSHLPAVAVDVSDQVEGIEELARFYHHGVGFGDPEWLHGRLHAIGARWGVEYAEEFDAWETEGGLTDTLLPAAPLANVMHPERKGAR